PHPNPPPQGGRGPEQGGRGPEQGGRGPEQGGRGPEQEGREPEQEGRRPVQLDPLSRMIADELLKEIRGRLGFLTNVGLHYLALDRAAPTLSGGEAQRIRLAQI